MLTKPRVVILCLERYQLFSAIYGPHISTLATRLEVCEATTLAQARRYLSSTAPPQAIIVADAFTTNPAYRDILFQLVDYAWAGGTVIYAGLVGCFTRPVDLDAAFQHAWGVPWRSSRFYQHTFTLNPTVRSISTNPQHTLPAYSMRARSISKVELADALYLEPFSVRRVETGLQGQLTYETPAAFAPVGHGFVGFVGDIGGEEGTIKLLMAMCLRPGAGAPLKSGTGVPARRASAASAVPGARPREAEVVARRSSRDMNRQMKAAMALQMKYEGDELYASEKWGEAANKYRNAALLAGPKSAYLDDLSAALLKLQRWDILESTASRALLHDPDQVESLYRRGIARKEMRRFSAAEADLQRVLFLNPLHESVRQEIESVRSLKLDEDLEEVYWPMDRLLIHEDIVEVDEDSDSEDSIHTGSGVPCKFYNHGGCLHSHRCSFMHAPDARSVRDDLGRNVCLYWLVGQCHYTEGICVYTHEATYLPPSGWWTNTERLERLRKAFDEAARQFPIDVSESIAAEALKPRSWRQDLWAAPVDLADEHYREAQQEPLPDPPRPISRETRIKKDFRAGKSYKSSSTGGARSSAGRRHQGRSGTAGSSRYRYRDDYDYDDFSEMEDRFMYCGFSKDDFDEMLCQGIKPWDEI
ncbi:hypothetical protein L226DRAFT_617797 [Lentinus tigrinus ALCF2SS1-7]|uniref:C3H1-type domain-containing protein n=1 Tax=Lentinus tigrinus ALCF2SS1-6 TaxID=1328759 RepID=A0A5C2RQV6_9APHY|nr:hypothetical protein L227DRAFT_658761 [Lentinus tigrinus ALCF2SS1-6]RPD67970.1 hypothetical protein L226DRAFT_617797 [Lentinus tigrinus ALCF2SS1-7]